MYSWLKSVSPWLAATFISLVMILANQNSNAVALRATLGDVVTVLVSPIALLFEMGRAMGENKQLRADLTTTLLALNQRNLSETENIRLRQMLGFKERTKWNLVMAEVVGLTLDQSITGFIINTGKSDGVFVNQGVVVPEGAVGRVFRAGHGSAAVQLITDANIGVAGRLLRSRENGITRALPGGKLRLEGIPVTADVDIGDTVITSGLDRIFPPGLILGIVEKAYPIPDGWLLQVEMRPSVDFTAIEEVFVVTNADQASRDSVETIH